MFCPKGKKKKKLNMQYISFMYKEFRPILLSELKIQNTFENAKWVCRMSVSTDLKVYVTSGSDVYSKMTQYGTSTSFSFTAKKGCTEKSRTKRFGNSLRLRPGTRIIQQNNLFTLKKSRGIKSKKLPRKAPNNHKKVHNMQHTQHPLQLTFTFFVS
jgi:hypothetical protein